MGAKTGTAPIIRKLKTKYPEMTERAIAERVGCSPGNVHHVLSRYNSDTTDADLRAFQENKADIVDTLALRVATFISDEKLKSSSASQLGILLGILIDKGELLHGRPTSLNVTVLMQAVEAMRSRGPAAPSPRVIDADPS